jgi:hypothetical protein
MFTLSYADAVLAVLFRNFQNFQNFQFWASVWARLDERFDVFDVDHLASLRKNPRWQLATSNPTPNGVVGNANLPRRFAHTDPLHESSLLVDLSCRSSQRRIAAALNLATV